MDPGTKSRPFLDPSQAAAQSITQLDQLAVASDADSKSRQSMRSHNSFKTESEVGSEEKHPLVKALREIHGTKDDGLKLPKVP